MYIFYTLTVVAVLVWISRKIDNIPQWQKNDVPLANRPHFWEPRFLARLRWACDARNILDRAHEKYKGQVYRVDRGDIELVVVPAELIPELNALPESILSSRHAHSYNLLGHINGIEVVKKTSLYFKTIMNKITPALPKMTDSIQQRISYEIAASFPQDTAGWTTVEPLQKIVHCISSVFSLIAVGAPLCDDPEHIRLISEQAELVFGLVVIMRLVPAFLQSTLVWLLPAKWRLEANLRSFERLIVPEARRLLKHDDLTQEGNLLAWMVQGVKTDVEKDPLVLTRLQAATAGGATHTTGMLIDNALFDLAAQPRLLREIREEIREQHESTGGRWISASYDGLHKLDSMLKETARVGPPSMTVYSRLLRADYTLSNGVSLRRGQMICVSGCSIQHDPARFADPATYDGFRAYHHNDAAARRDDGHGTGPQPFKFVDQELLWGAGRWACPGRFLATLEAKIVLVKFINEYDVRLPSGKARPRHYTFHDYGFIGEHEQLEFRRRTDSIDIGY